MVERHTGGRLVMFAAVNIPRQPPYLVACVHIKSNFVYIVIPQISINRTILETQPANW